MTYGRDTYCLDELRTGRTVSGAELVAQAVYRRLTTARGTLRDGDEGLIYGLDVQGFVGSVGTESSIAALPDVIRSEVSKDGRIETCDVTVLPERHADGTVSLTISIDCTLADEDSGFSLSLSVSDVSVALLGITTS